MLKGTSEHSLNLKLVRALIDARHWGECVLQSQNVSMCICSQKGTCGHGLIQWNENTIAVFQRSLEVNAQVFKRQVCCLQKCFKKLWNCLPKWLCHFALPLAMNESSYLSTSLQVFGVVHILDFSLSDRCAAISHCYFSLY